MLLALFQRQAERRSSTAQSLLVGIGRTPDWPARIDAFVDGMARLRAGDAASTALAAELLEAGRLSREDAKIVARCVLEVNATPNRRAAARAPAARPK